VFLYSSAREGVAWLEALDDSWGQYGGAVYDAAVRRRDDDDPAPAEGPAP